MGLSSPNRLIDWPLEEQEAFKRSAPRDFDVITKVQTAARDAGSPVPHNIEVLQESHVLTRAQWRETGEEHFAKAEELLAKDGRDTNAVLLAQAHATLAVAAATLSASGLR